MHAGVSPVTWDPYFACRVLKEPTFLTRCHDTDWMCRTGERIHFNYLISQKYTGEHAQLDLLRKGEEVSLRVPLDRPHALVPLHLGGLQPSYLVVAGAAACILDPLLCCCTTLSAPY